MGKLIEADVVKAFLKRVIWGKDPQIDAWVDAMPEADAIPMEFIHDLIDDNEPITAKAAIAVKRAWEREHHAPGK